MTAHRPHPAYLLAASRALGVVAIVLVSLSVGVGLALAGRIELLPPARAARPSSSATGRSLALAGLIASHPRPAAARRLYLRPSLAGITLPFALASKPVWTGLGIIGGWLTR